MNPLEDSQHKPEVKKGTRKVLGYLQSSSNVDNLNMIVIGKKKTGSPGWLSH